MKSSRSIKKRTNKHDQTVNDLQTRKRMEELSYQNCQRIKNTYTKTNDRYWDTTIRENKQLKKQRIIGEMKTAHENYEELKLNNEKPLEEMTVSELKEQIKSMCLVTKLRNREKLVDFIQSNL